MRWTMTLKLRQFLAMLVLLLAGACTDGPTSPHPRAGEAGPSSTIALPPVGVTVCQFGGTYPYCWDEPNPPPPEPDPSCYNPWACNGGGSGGGGDGGDGGDGTAPPPPPTTEPTDTCKTGDKIVDDPQVSKGLALLWQQSNPDANLYQRAEKAGWIVESPTGRFSIIQWTGGTERFGCGDYTSLTVPPKEQGTVVGFVHTHPYRVDETITDCGLRGVDTYRGEPSDADRQTSVDLGAILGRPGPLPGYIIDKDGYYRYDGKTNTATPRRQRCGY
jgi:hypothetical protein